MCFDRMEWYLRETMTISYRHILIALRIYRWQSSGLLVKWTDGLLRNGQQYNDSRASRVSLFFFFIISKALTLRDDQLGIYLFS